MTVSASISHLLMHRRPDAVARLISPRIITTLDCLTGRPFAHVLKERLERCPPSVADDDAPRTVPPEPFIILVMASLNQSVPDTIGAAYGAPAILTMLRGAGLHIIDPLASA